MRCPKCGYNSFDHLDSCKKCGKDLVEFKERYNIRSVLFPGQMAPVSAVAADGPAGRSAVDDAVAAAATATAVTAAATAARATTVEPEFAEAGETASSEADDFGFDFMGESGEEEDLSFDELFEDAPADEDVEETLPSPEEEAAASKAEAGLDAPKAFSFDSAADSEDEKFSSDTELESDFGFDLDAEGEPSAEKKTSADNLSVEDFELPPTDEEDFSFRDDNIEFEDSGDEDEEGTSGTKEDPKDPFDLPGSPQAEGNPVASPTSSEAFTSSNRRPADLPLTDTDGIETDFVPPEQPVSPDSLSAEDLPNAARRILFSGPSAVAEDIIAFENPVSEPDEIGPSFEECQAEPELRDVPDAEAEFFAEIEPPAEETAAQGISPPAAETQTDPISLDPAEAPDVFPGPFAGLPAVDMKESQSQTLKGDPLAAAASAAAVQASPVQPAVTETKVAMGNDGAGQFHPPLGGRVAAFCCDLLLLFAVSLCFIVAAELAMSAEGDGWLPNLETLINLSVPYFLVLFFLAFGYFTLFHFLAGQTPGKMLAGLQVETLAGEPLQFSQAFLRSVGGLLQALPVGLGYLVILFSEDRRGWNDRLAGTRLILLKKPFKKD